jgi:hypothetical protein
MIYLRFFQMLSAQENATYQGGPKYRFKARIREMLGSKLCRDIDYSDLCYLWLSPVTPAKWRYSALN